MALASKLALGTVQFGLNYGIANKSGQTHSAEVSKILEHAYHQKINCLDTAIAYGNSEEVLGEVGTSAFKVISKLPPLPTHPIDIESWVSNHAHESLARLKISSLHGLLLHKSQNLRGVSGQKLATALINLQSSGLVKKIGVSIYDPSELDFAMEAMQIDLVQAPLNIIDRRLETSGWLDKLHKDGVEIHTRSAFLQGLLLMSRQNVPSWFERWADLWDKWSHTLKEARITAAEACLSYPLSLPHVNRVVVGVDTLNQLKELVSAEKSQLTIPDLSFMSSDEEDLINPTNWPKK